MADLQDLIDRIDWETFRNLEPPEHTLNMGFSSFEHFRQDSGKHIIRESYYHKHNQKFALPSPPSLKNLMKIVYPGRTAPIDLPETETISKEEIEHMLIESANISIDWIKQNYGSSYVSKISDAILDWHGEYKMHPNVLYNFVTAVEVTDQLSISQAKRFLDLYSPLCFDEGFMDSLTTDFRTFSKDLPEFVDPLISFYESMSNEINTTHENMSLKHYRAYFNRVNVTYSEPPPRFPDGGKMDVITLSTTNHLAQAAWDTTINNISLFSRYNAKDHAEKFLKLTQKFIPSFHTTTSIGLGLKQYIHEKIVDREEKNGLNGVDGKEDYDYRITGNIYPREEIETILQFFEDIEFGNYSEVFNEFHRYRSRTGGEISNSQRILELIVTGDPRPIVEEILKVSQNEDMSSYVDLITTAVLDYYERDQDINQTLHYIKASTDTSILVKLEKFEDFVKRDVFKYVVSKIVSGDDYSEMLSILGPMPEEAASKLIRRLSDEQLVLKLSDTFSEEIKRAEEEYIRIHLFPILREMSLNYIEKINSAASERKFANLEERLDFFYYRHLIFKRDSDRYLPIIGQDLEIIEQSLREEFFEQFQFKLPTYSDNLNKRIEKTLNFFDNAQIPEVATAFQQEEKHGSFKKSFENIPEAIQSIELLKEHGYNTDFYVASGAEIATATSELGEYIDWKTVFNSLIPKVIGYGPGENTEITIPTFPPNYIYNEIKKDYELANQGDIISALFVVELLQGMIIYVPDKLRNTTIENFRDELAGLHSQIESNSITQGGSLTARMWTRELPDSLYDDEELACCTFLPDGPEKDEAPRMVLDPQVSMIEYFVNREKPKKSVAIMYAGKDNKILLDTWTSNQSIYSVLGNRKTREFVLDSLVDATLNSLPEAEKPILVVYDSDYGRSQELADFIKSKMRIDKSISYDLEYPFEAVDVENFALSNLSGKKQHYTDAFTVERKHYNPLKGNIKAYVIDAKKYIQNNNLIGKYLDQNNTDLSTHTLAIETKT